MNKIANSVICLRKKMCCVSEPTSATDRMCTEARWKQSLCKGGLWTQSYGSKSCSVISHTPTYSASMLGSE